MLSHGDWCHQERDVHTGVTQVGLWGPGALSIDSRSFTKGLEKVLQRLEGVVG